MASEHEARSLVREIAAAHYARGDALGWFDALYEAAAGDESLVPWADLRPHWLLTEWLRRHPAPSPGSTAIVVGCGLGDDAEAVAAAGYSVRGFDLSPRAIEWCRRRFSGSPVDYQVADLLDLGPAWAASLVVEVYTLQSLPWRLRRPSMLRLAELVAPGGLLVAIARGREEDEPANALPWPLTRTELTSLAGDRLELVSFDDRYDDEDPPKRRFVATFAAPSHGPPGGGVHPGT